MYTNPITAKSLIALTVLVITVGALLFVADNLALFPMTDTKQVAPPTQKQIEQLSKSAGFNYVVSYRDTGFQPAHFTAHVGETVRFTNSSTQGIFITRSDENPASGPCEAGSFDSCEPLAQGDFWEYTFTTAETISYMDKFNPNNAGTIVVIQ